MDGLPARTAFFARIDLLVNIVTIVIQVFLTGRIIRWLGIGTTLALLPAVTMIGFLGLSIAPTLGVLVVFQVGRRAANFALAKPARESLFTVVSREDKYKAKSFVDTFVHRGGDAIGAIAEKTLTVSTKAVSGGLAFVAAWTLPLGALWLVVAVLLGRRQRSTSPDRRSATNRSRP